jgi:hypothetical protein
MLAEVAGLLITVAVGTGVLRGAARGGGRVSAAEAVVYVVLLVLVMWLLMGIITSANRTNDPSEDDYGVRTGYLLCRGVLARHPRAYYKAARFTWQRPV